MSRPAVVDGEQLLAFIDAFIDEHAGAPSYREMATAMGGVSLGSIRTALRRLREAGRIEWSEGRACAIRVVEG